MKYVTDRQISMQLLHMYDNICTVCNKCYRARQWWHPFWQWALKCLHRARHIQYNNNCTDSYCYISSQHRRFVFSFLFLFYFFPGCFLGMETVSITLLRTPASSPWSECTSCHQEGHAGNKTVHQQNPPVLNWRYLQCSDTVGWVSWRPASGLQKLSDEVLPAWLSVWSKMQIVCMWSSWCKCHPKTPSSLASFKSRLVLPFCTGLPRLSWKKGR